MVCLNRDLVLASNKLKVLERYQNELDIESICHIPIDYIELGKSFRLSNSRILEFWVWSYNNINANMAYCGQGLSSLKDHPLKEYSEDWIFYAKKALKVELKQLSQEIWKSHYYGEFTISAVDPRLGVLTD